MNKIVVKEHEVAMTTPYRRSVAENLKKNYDYVLPKEAYGMYTCFCADIDQTTKKPKKTALVIIVERKADKGKATEIANSFVQRHKGEDFSIWAVYADKEKGQRIYDIKYLKNGKIRLGEWMF